LPLRLSGQYPGRALFALRLFVLAFVPKCPCSGPSHVGLFNLIPASSNALIVVVPTSERPRMELWMRNCTAARNLRNPLGEGEPHTHTNSIKDVVRRKCGRTALRQVGATVMSEQESPKQQPALNPRFAVLANDMPRSAPPLPYSRRHCLPCGDFFCGLLWYYIPRQVCSC